METKSKSNKSNKLEFSLNHINRMKELEKEYGVRVLQLPRIRAKNSYNTLFINAEELLMGITLNETTKESPKLVYVSQTEQIRDIREMEEVTFYFLDRFYTINIIHYPHMLDTYVVESSSTNEIYYFHTMQYTIKFLKALAFFEKVSTEEENIVIEAPEETYATGRIFLDNFLYKEEK